MSVGFRWSWMNMSRLAVGTILGEEPECEESINAIYVVHDPAILYVVRRR
jgi:hypothetical protein